jgi:hypothetical protein
MNNYSYSPMVINPSTLACIANSDKMGLAFCSPEDTMGKMLFSGTFFTIPGIIGDNEE